LLEGFYTPFADALKIAKIEMEKVELESGEDCPECQKPLLIRGSRYGDFLGCSGYPECTYKKSKLDKIGLSCREEGCDGEVVSRRTKKRYVFFGCSKYPTCKFTSWDKPVEQNCPTCGKFMVMKRSMKGKRPYLVCSDAECKTTQSISATKDNNKDNDKDNDKDNN